MTFSATEGANTVTTAADIAPVLQNEGQPVAEDNRLDVPVAGLTLELVFFTPPSPIVGGATSHWELTEAELQLQTPDPAESAVLGPNTNPLGATVNTDQGPVTWDAASGNWSWPPDPDDGAGTAPVTWITVDFGTPCVVTRLDVTATGADTARLKVSSGGPWFPPVVPDTVALNVGVSLPDVPASKLMIEFVESETAASVSATVSAVTVTANNPAGGIRVAIGEDQPFFNHPDPLPTVASGSFLMVEGLAEAVNRALSASPSGGSGSATVPIVLRSTGAGPIIMKEFSATPVWVAGGAAGLPDGAALALPWDGEVTGRLAVSDSALGELGFSLAFTPQDVFLEPEGLDANSAHLCDGTYHAAQGIGMLPEGAALAGVDLYLRPLSSAVRGIVAIHPDDSGRPAAAPFPGTELPVALDTYGGGPWPARWVPVLLATPLLLGDADWWIVLTITDGAALWYLQRPPDGASGSVYRVGTGAWLRRVAPLALERLEGGEGDAVWAMTRVRIATPVGEGSLWVEVRRGSAKRNLLPDPSGWVAATPADLEGLNGGEGEFVDLTIAGKLAGSIVCSQFTARLHFAPEATA